MAITLSSVTQPPSAQAGVNSPETRARERASDVAQRRAETPKPPENPSSPPSEAAQVRLSAEGRARSAARAAEQNEVAAAAQNAVQPKPSGAANRTAANGVAAYQRVFDL